MFLTLTMSRRMNAAQVGRWRELVGGEQVGKEFGSVWVASWAAGHC